MTAVVLAKWKGRKEKQLCHSEEKVSFYLQDLSIDIEHVDGDLYIPGYALPTLFKLAFLQGDVKVIPHLSCGNRKVEEATRH